MVSFYILSTLGRFEHLEVEVHAYQRGHLRRLVAPCNTDLSATMPWEKSKLRALLSRVSLHILYSIGINMNKWTHCCPSYISLLNRDIGCFDLDFLPGTKTRSNHSDPPQELFRRHPDIVKRLCTSFSSADTPGGFNHVWSVPKWPVEWSWMGNFMF